MQKNSEEKRLSFNKAYPACRRLIPDEIWCRLVADTESLALFAEKLAAAAAELQLPEYLSELARLEFYVYGLEADGSRPEPFNAKLSINPSLELFANSWKNLAALLDGGPDDFAPEKELEHVIVWRQPLSGEIKAKAVSQEELLALKMALEGLSAREVAGQGGVSVAAVQSALIRALNEGIVIGPEPRLKRDFAPEEYQEVDRSFFSARIFTLQWHITQACDLHCRHCYDRRQYKSLDAEQETFILDDLAGFCASHNVHGQVTFTGGNPLLHPRFESLYRQAAERGLTTAILGNPAVRQELERLLAIQPPAFYQVSLEGLEEHNDHMRGKGHFQRVLGFLDLLRELKIYSMVMLTLTSKNMDQVLELAGILRLKTDLFTFNRLSLVGEGANLVMAAREKYPGFLRDYLAAVDSNPCLGLKDNLLNILHHDRDRPLFGGCTGYGCGAAYNFISVLADGSVQACRKFPSPLGSILDRGLSEIYHSEAAERYRQGPAACRDCAIMPVCRGCLAVAHSQGLDIFREKDPYCFMDDRERRV